MVLRNSVEKDVPEEGRTYGLDSARREQVNVGDRERMGPDVVADRKTRHIRSIDRQRIKHVERRGCVASEELIAVAEVVV